jgi:hypothetical protein
VTGEQCAQVATDCVPRGLAISGVAFGIVLGIVLWEALCARQLRRERDEARERARREAAARRHVERDRKVISPRPVSPEMPATRADGRARLSSVPAGTTRRRAR